ncbi:homoserine kinase [Actinomycetospora chlora]|uniref:Homoserine kinase n=1 Tax=Actinomycetospora chlora TaxID=663608 RepID=A0ABP9CMZ6_9PSEU
MAGERTAAAAGDAVRVRVPATSANLGPGFDTLGLALGMWDDVELAVGDGDGCVVEVEGEGAGRVPRDERHLVLRAARATFDRAGAPRAALRLRCRNLIPHSRGLGSSAAAAVAGIVGARALLAASHPLDDEAVLDLAAGFDGHADNAAACLHGGLVVSWGHEGAWRAVRLSPHPALRPVALIAERSSSTEATRGLLPDRVPHTDAAYNAARSALLVHALTNDPSLLLEATEDRLHQPYRRPAYPETAAVVDHLRAEGVAAVVSGAGPTVLALTLDGRLPDALDTSGFTVRALDVDTAGARAEHV